MQRIINNNLLGIQIFLFGILFQFWTEIFYFSSEDAAHF